MADWEHGFLMQALNFQNMARGEKYGLCTFGRTKDAVKTAGGVTILPDVSVDDVKKDDCGLLLLIGGDTWMTDLHGKVLGLAQDFLADGINVAAICGAAAALAERGLLDEKKHTSNSLGYLKMFCRNLRMFLQRIPIRLKSEKSFPRRISMALSIPMGCSWKRSASTALVQS